MAGMSYEQFAQILLHAPGGFELHETRSDGKVNVYTGRDLQAFLQGADNRQHEHKVFDSKGKLVYERGPNGHAYIDDRNSEFRMAIQKHKLGTMTVGGVLKDSFRRSQRAGRWMYNGGRD